MFEISVFSSILGHHRFSSNLSFTLESSSQKVNKNMDGQAFDLGPEETGKYDHLHSHASWA